MVKSATIRLASDVSSDWNKKKKKKKGLMKTKLNFSLGQLCGAAFQTISGC